MSLSFNSPSNVSELAELLKKATPMSRILSGGTDLIIELNEGRIAPDCLIDISYISEIKSIEQTGELLKIGACVSFSEIHTNPLVLKYCPALASAAKGVGSKQIRNRGTIGGNLANSSPAGDMLPPLVLLDACVDIVDSSGQIKSKKACDVIKNRLKYDEVILHINVPIKKENEYQVFLKLGSRKAVTIARLSIAAVICIENNTVCGAKVALGAIGRSPIISIDAASVLLEVSPCDWDYERFLEALSEEVRKAIPGRYSLPYKQQSIKGLGEDVLDEFKRLTEFF